MAKGGGMPGNFNMNNLMKQAQKMQKDMEKAQQGLELLKIETTSGGGAVKVEMNGKKVLTSLTIDPEVLDPDDVEMLQDLVLTAVNEAIRQVEEKSSTEMNKITGGLNMGGLF